ncbi:MAG: Fic family protein [Ruminococcaceae bacterium]|nr:Fic family protein [Oscillospiraceae bacterium]
MDIKLFTAILKDKRFPDYKKLKYKYGENFDAFLQTLAELYYKPLPVADFAGAPIVFLENYAAVSQRTVKLLLQAQTHNYGIKAAEDEIIATSAIESIDFSRDSVRNILKGMAPKDEQESRILGLKKGLEFIADTANRITEENLHHLYMMVAGDFLEGDDRLKDGCLYRHDAVYVVGDEVEHTGLDYRKVPKYIKALIAFANTDDDINDLVKAAIVHFCFSYIHPYFDGNGRVARLLHLWFLIQKGYRSALFIPFSSSIEKSRKAYYDAYTLTEENRRLSGVIDVTPFVLYFVNNVYNKMSDSTASADTVAVFEGALKDGKITEKEKQLWQFVLSCYGTEEFSTKQLEKDFGNAAYATIRSFVLKFEEMGLLSSAKYSTRVRYRVAG